VEPFTLLDVELRREIWFSLHTAHNALVYVLTGGVLVSADGRQQKVAGEHALALYGSGGRMRFEALQPAHFLLLSILAAAPPSSAARGRKDALLFALLALLV
jgi:redox-sensitive bicupin YhaK (pirin superfamily)